MKLIVAVDEKWGIGKDGDLLLSIPDDMRFFREKTRRAVLVMGYNTLLSFPGGRPLPFRMNIVLNNEPGVRAAGTLICDSTEQLFSVLRDMKSDDVFVIGGGSIYRQLLPYCDTAYITKMRFDGEADTYIPDLDELSEWSVVSESKLMEHEGISYSFVEYRNQVPLSVGFSGADIDMPAYFTKKTELSFSCPDSFDSDHRAELNALLSAYFRPLSGGMTADEVAEGLSTGKTLESLLREKKLIARAEDIESLSQRYSSGAAHTVSVTRESLDGFTQEQI